MSECGWTMHLASHSLAQNGAIRSANYCHSGVIAAALNAQNQTVSAVSTCWHPGSKGHDSNVHIAHFTEPCQGRRWMLSPHPLKACWREGTAYMKYHAWISL